MKKKMKILLIVALLIGYIVCFTYEPFIFFPLGLLTLYFLGFYVIFLFIINFTFNFLSQDTSEKYKEKERNKKIVISICCVFFFIGTWGINHYLLPNHLHPISLIGDVGIFLFTIFLMWTLIYTRGKEKRIFIGTTILILFIFLLIFIYPNNDRNINTNSLEALKSLPYLSMVSVQKDSEGLNGVTKYDSDLAYNGLNIYNIDSSKIAYLIDMSGQTVHTWSDGKSRLQYVEMCRNGDLLGIIGDRGLVKLDWYSDVKWMKRMRFHHDIAIARNNDIYTLVREDEFVFDRSLPLPILNDYILILSKDGEIKKRISIFKLFKKEIPSSKFIKIYIWILSPKILVEMIKNRIGNNFIFQATPSYPVDIFHTNTVEIIDKAIKGICKKGDVLFCICNFDLIGILDIEKGKSVWLWGPGELSKPHHPTILENGNILVFDNGWERNYSRVVEINPLTKKIVWEYKANPPDSFFSLKRGSNQRLPNGNTLITESDKGHIFEITHDGNIVWEFYTFIDKNKGKRGAVYRMMRITDPEKYPHIYNLR